MKKSVAVDIIEALVEGRPHEGEFVAHMPSMHLHNFVGADGRLPCFLRELARYIEAEEAKRHAEWKRDRL